MGNPKGDRVEELIVYQAMAARFEIASEKLNLDLGLCDYLRVPGREIILHLPVAMDSGHYPWLWQRGFAYGPPDALERLQGHGCSRYSRGRQTYEKRFAKSVARDHDYLHDEIFRILGSNKVSVLDSDYSGAPIY